MVSKVLIFKSINTQSSLILFPLFYQKMISIITTSHTRKKIKTVISCSIYIQNTNKFETNHEK